MQTLNPKLIQKAIITSNVMKEYMKHQPNIFLNTYLILEKDNQTLLLLRHNTGYGDGFYNLVAGHVEPGERVVPSIVREAQEEANITINSENLELVHINHHMSDRENIDVFFRCTEWSGEVKNNEPLKHKELVFFDKNNLPENLHSYIKQVFANIEKSIVYGEWLEKREQPYRQVKS